MVTNGLTTGDGGGSPILFRMSRPSQFLLLLVFAGRVVAQEAVPSIRPILRSEKPKYVLGELIRFWEGLQPANSNEEFPAEIWKERKPCSLKITRPDGTAETRAMNWPVDGDLRHGWLGGSTLKADAPGKYTLVLECGGVSSEPLSFPVEKDGIIKKVKISLKFEKSGSLRQYASVPVVFDVRNNSNFPIQFPERGSMLTEGVSVRVVRREPPERHEMHYPFDKLGKSVAPEVVFDWKDASRIRSVNLVPGGHLAQNLYLDDVFKFDRPGEYDVTVSTVVSILVGEPNGPYQDKSPIRLPVEQTESFTITQ